ncbi:aminoglycoside phosphotransferase family protein [Streptomyces triticirhizae]|uniref:Aminoglycoside phosphotransferase family protein n=1 Tax=Streptomyces triticirhizae TaxID=2483353 RepID=A0A3M2M291_9ACTN|nr:aminoglycoside phosphotransferase family protein [Streptomyces triticirhizae]
MGGLGPATAGGRAAGAGEAAVGGEQPPPGSEEPPADGGPPTAVGVLRAMGLRPLALLGQGMEGTVYRLADGLVGKVWSNGRTAAEARRFAAFHAELAAQRLPFATPEPVAVRERDGLVVTVERELPGVPLSEAGLGPAAGHAAVVEVVTALRTTTAGPAARALPALGEAAPLWAGHSSWPEALAALVERRATAGRTAFARALSGATARPGANGGGPDAGPVADAGVGAATGPVAGAGAGAGAGSDPGADAGGDWRAGQDAVLAGVLARLRALPTSDGPARVVHGDICPPNILVDNDGRVVGLLDWGFLSTAGDNAFDAATAAGFFDMYGPEARGHDEALLVTMTGQLGYPRETLLTYRAAYALATATVYSSAGDDGHFAWCVNFLQRPEVRELLGLGMTH